MGTNAVRVTSTSNTSKSVYIPSDKLPTTTGLGKICYAPSGSNTYGALLDTSFVDQGVQLEFIDQEVALLTYKTSVSSTITYLEFESNVNEFNLAVLPYATIGCEGALSQTATYSNTVFAYASGFTSDMKICFSPLSNPGSDDDFMDQGYLVNKDDPHLIIDETFNTDNINLAMGIARDTANGDIYVTSSQDGKVYKITSGGVKSEFYSGLNEPWGIDVDS